MSVPSFSEQSPARICIHAPNWVGDVVMATPLMRSVRRNFTSSRILLLVRNNVEPVVKKAPWFDEVVTYPAGGVSGTFAFWRTMARLRREAFDLGLILPNSFKTALLFFMGGVENRVGYIRDARRFMLHHPLPRPGENGEFHPVYMADYYLGLGKGIGLNHSDSTTELHFCEEDVSRTRSILKSQCIDPDRRIFLLHPGAAYGPSKKWRNRRWARLAELLENSFDVEICLIGGEQEAETCRRIQALSGADVSNLQGSKIDLHLLKCLVSMSDLLVTTDSGPRHYGVACSIATVCLMGPTHPDYSTSGRPHDIVIQCTPECGPCQKKVCPEDHRCMENISPRLVFSHCLGALMKNGTYEK